MLQEYYIRQKDVDESRGPFTVEQLASLAEAGQIDDETIIYDVDRETWEELAHMPELRASLFPEQRKLNLKPKEVIARLNVESEDDAPVTVDEMLAAAEGRTKGTKHKMRIDELQEYLAYVGMHVAAVIFLLSGIALFVPDMGLLFGFDFAAMMRNPLVLIGAVDLGLAFILFLRTTAVYPFIRFRAALGVGFFTVLYLSYDEPLLLASVVLGSIALYFCTISATIAPVAIATVIGLLGMGTYAYLILLT